MMAYSLARIYICMTALWMGHINSEQQDDQQFCSADDVCVSCLDVDDRCPSWSSIGECRKNPKFMLRFCQKSCNNCGPCQDEAQQCPEWAKDKQCEANPRFMLKTCRLSCNVPPCVVAKKSSEDFGLEQEVDESDPESTVEAFEAMKQYFERLRNDPETTDRMHELLDNCKNQHENCAIWAVLGECDNNPAYMRLKCAAVCRSCDQLGMENRCPMDPDAPNAWNPNDLNQFFLNVTTLEEFHRYQPKVLSRPDFVNGDTEETADYIIGPWVITLDSFLTKEEAERMIELGSIEGYKRSSDIGDMNVDGTFGETVGDGRTSTNAWCQTSSCYNDTIARRVMDRITNLTNIPEENSEYLQILQYEQGQYYREHHDFIEFEVERRQGPRMLTVYIYLNDVESGGGTNFPRLGLTVMPKQGRCLIWPSVMNDNPEEKDERTNHQALEVVKGTKYGVNAWLHRRNFKAVLKDRCI